MTGPYTQGTLPSDGDAEFSTGYPAMGGLEIPQDVAATKIKVADILNQSLIHERISSADQERSMESILSIFDLEQEQADEDESMLDSDEEIEDLEDQRRRTEKLKEALELLGNLWWSGSDYMELLTEKLADGSRDRKSSQSLLSAHQWLPQGSYVSHLVDLLYLSTTSHPDLLGLLG